MVPGHGAGQAGDRRLGGIVLNRVVAGDDCTVGGDVDDAALAETPHHRDGRLGAEGVPLDVDAPNGVPAFLAGIGHGVVETDGGVVHQNIQPPEALYRAPDEGLGLGLALHPGFHEKNLASPRPDLLSHLAAAGAVPVGKGHPRPLRHKQPHRRFANAGGATGDRRHLAVQSSHRSCP